jgi:hypothetical protein
MPLSEFTKKLVETKLTEYCERKIPIDIRHQVKPGMDFDDMLKALDNNTAGIF